MQSDLAKDEERPVSQHDSATYELLNLGELLLISLGLLSVRAWQKTDDTLDGVIWGEFNKGTIYKGVNEV